jgi:hypothetical protein
MPQATAPRKMLIAVLAAALVTALAPPSLARTVDLVRAGTRVGPVRFGETTLRQTQRWFGEPSSKKRMRVGCIRALRARWGRGLVVFFTTGTGKRIAVQGTVRRRTLGSTRHGVLRFRTLKGLRVQNRNRKLRRLYPRVRPVRHRRHFDHFLVSGPSKGRLVAITKHKKGRVRALFAGPYETC